MHMPKQTVPFFYVNKTKFKPQATVQKSGTQMSIYDTLGLKYMDVI